MLEFYYLLNTAKNVDIPDKNSTKSRRKLTEWKIRSQKLLVTKIKLNCFERLNASKWIQETQFSISLSTKWWYGTKGYQFANTYEPETEICWTRWNQYFYWQHSLSNYQHNGTNWKYFSYFGVKTHNKCTKMIDFNIFIHWISKKNTIFVIFIVLFLLLKTILEEWTAYVVKFRIYMQIARQID